MRLRSLLSAALCLAATSLSAQSFTNGSLTGPIANNGVPAGWTSLAGSPDTMDQFNNVGTPGVSSFGATPTASPNGGTWVGIGREGTGFIERFGQTVSGFSIGQSYTVSWFVSNFGYTDFGYTNANQIEVLVNGVSIGSGAVRALSTGWEAQSLLFTATAATQQIAFQLGSNNKSYMGIDGIAFGPSTVVPEPATFALLAVGAGVLGLVARRRREL
jgi:hypothetical protein